LFDITFEKKRQMLFKDKLLLANCDSVKNCSFGELQKRLLIGTIFADGIIISPNVLIDNDGVDKLLSSRRLINYFNDEGHGKFVIRGVGVHPDQELMDYYESLPNSFILSSFKGAPRKEDLSSEQQDIVIERIKSIQNALNQFHFESDSVDLKPNSLKSQIEEKIKMVSSTSGYFLNEDEKNKFFQKSTELNIVSRSQWYRYAQSFFDEKRPESSNIFSAFKSEVIDTSYNSLFVRKGEGFLQDEVKYLEKIPAPILDHTMSLMSVRNEIGLISDVYDSFETITSFGANDLVDIVAEKALDYIEDKMADKGSSLLKRKHWFGMRPILQKKIGLEIK
jgi:hypothetical protein